MTDCRKTAATAACIWVAVATIAVLPGPAQARTYAERAGAALKQLETVAEDLYESSEPDLLAVGAVEQELIRLKADIEAEDQSHAKLNEALEHVSDLTDGGIRNDPVKTIVLLGLSIDAMEKVTADFTGGFLSSEPSELPVAGSQTVFDTGVRNWMPFSGVTREVSDGAEFTGWDEDAAIVLVNRGGEIMLSIENGNYTAKWLMPVPFARSVSFGIDSGNDEFVLLSVHAPDASTHFLIDRGGSGKMFVHRH